MAKTTYTVVMQCHRCDRETTQTGVRLKGEYEYGSVECHCRECGATGTASLLYREIHRPCGASVGFDTVASDSFRASAIVTREPPPIEAHTGLILDHSDAGVGPAADEWSKPVKLHGGDWIIGEATPSGDNHAVILTPAREVSNTGGHANPVPSDVVLRLLAAEASDRLGWVWEVDTGDWIASGGKSMWGRHAETGEPITYDDHFGSTADDLLASLHGRFLLADALREAGQ